MEPIHENEKPSAPADNPPVYTKTKPADNPPPIEPVPNTGVSATKVAPAANQSDKRQGPDITQVKPANIVPVPAAQQVTPLNRLGETAEWIDCPWCQRMTKTRVEKDNSDTTTLAAMLCCLTCGICCICIPCLMGVAQDTDHYCTNCNRKVMHKPHQGPSEVLEPKTTGTVVSQYAAVGVVKEPQKPSAARAG